MISDTKHHGGFFWGGRVGGGLIGSQSVFRYQNNKSTEREGDIFNTDKN